MRQAASAAGARRPEVSRRRRTVSLAARGDRGPRGPAIRGSVPARRRERRRGRHVRRCGEARVVEAIRQSGAGTSGGERPGRFRAAFPVHDGAIIDRRVADVLRVPSAGVEFGPTPLRGDVARGAEGRRASGRPRVSHRGARRRSRDRRCARDAGDLGGGTGGIPRILVHPSRARGSGFARPRWRSARTMNS